MAWRCHCVHTQGFVLFYFVFCLFLSSQPGLGLGWGEWDAQGTKFKEAVTLRGVQMQGQCLSMHTSLNFAPFTHLTQTQTLFPASPNYSGFPICQPPHQLHCLIQNNSGMFLSGHFSTRWNGSQYPTHSWIQRTELGFRLAESPFLHISFFFF